jgi:hypothetical protein
VEKLSKTEAKGKVEEFFKSLEGKKPEEIRKIKNLAAHHNLKLGDKRKRFCMKCYSTNLKVKSIKNQVKTVKCENGHTSRWRIR